MTEQKLTAKERRELGRQQAAAKRALEKRRKKTKKIATISIISVAVVAVIAIVLTVVLNTAAVEKTPEFETSPNNMNTNSFIMTAPDKAITNKAYNLATESPVADSADMIKEAGVDDRVHVKIFLDYDCSHCKDFEGKNSAMLEKLLGEEKIVLESAPIVVIGSPLSYRGANAQACTVNFAPDSALTVNNSLFGLQSAAGNNNILQTVKQAGMTDSEYDQIAACVHGASFMPWVQAATDNTLELTNDAGQQLVPGTPAVYVDGEYYSGSPDLFAAYLNEKIIEKSL